MPYKDKKKADEYRKKYYAANRGKARSYQKAWVEKNREKFRDYQRKWQAENREQVLKRSKEYTARVKLEVFTHYSGGVPKCICCGETEIKFLALDHIHGKGNKHRRMTTGEGKAGMTMYRWARNNNYPKMFQILCHNCNMAKGFWGVCPHINKNRAQKI
ncbi:MAG TPA: hypothetical protein VIJ14_00920 [Rhabdochlamydiaceae bacterium]